MRNKKICSIILLSILIIVILFIISSCQNDKNDKVEIVEPEMKVYDTEGNLVVPENQVAFAVYGKGGKEGDIILDTVFVKYKDKMSAADLSKAVCREKNIPIVFSGMGTMMYVQGINNLFEFDDGSESGWGYSVNGEFQGVSSGSYTVQDKDFVEWFYTLDLGKDVGGYELD